MTTNTRVTLKSTNLRIDAIDAKLDAILAALDSKAPAKTVRKAPAKKAPAKKAAVAKPVKTVRYLCKTTRVDFVAAALEQDLADFTGWSTKAIAKACLDCEAAIPAGFGIGEGYRDLFAG